MEVVLSIAGVGGFLLALIWVQHVRERTRMQRWAEVAARLKLEYDGDRIHGRLNEISVELRTETRSSGKSQNTYTIFTADLDGTLPTGLDLAPEGVLLKIGKVAGMQDIHLDLPGIDEKIMVRGEDPEEVRRWAQRVDVSRGLVDLIALRVDFRVFPHELKLESIGALRDIEVIEARLEKLAHIARALSGRGYGALIDDGQW